MSDFPPSEVKGPNLFERTKEEIEAIMQVDQKKESHGMYEDIDEETPLDDVKASNLFERAKGEVEALIQTIHRKKDSPIHGISIGEHGKGESKQEKPNFGSDSDGKKPNFIEKAKETIEKIIHHENPPRHHHKETHGMSDDIDESTRIDEVKGPSIFERAKEEIEAVFQAIHTKKEHRK